VRLLCFEPQGALPVGDVMLAQKVALELFEWETLAVANKSQDGSEIGTTHLPEDDDGSFPESQKAGGVRSPTSFAVGRHRSSHDVHWAADGADFESQPTTERNYLVGIRNDRRPGPIGFGIGCLPVDDGPGFQPSKGC
jgi:hypothetical protein